MNVCVNNPLISDKLVRILLLTITIPLFGGLLLFANADPPPASFVRTHLVLCFTDFLTPVIVVVMTCEARMSMQCRWRVDVMRRKASGRGG